MDGELAKQRLGDMVVAALGDPGQAEIAAAHMRAHGHPGRLVGERLIDQADVDQVLVLGVAADAIDIGALHRVVEIGEAGVVELQVAAAHPPRPAISVRYTSGEVAPECIGVGIGGLIAHRAIIQHRP